MAGPAQLSAAELQDPLGIVLQGTGQQHATAKRRSVTGPSREWTHLLNDIAIEIFFDLFGLHLEALNVLKNLH